MGTQVSLKYSIWVHKCLINPPFGRMGWSRDPPGQTSYPPKWGDEPKMDPSRIPSAMTAKPLIWKYWSLLMIQLTAISRPLFTPVQLIISLHMTYLKYPILGSFWGVWGDRAIPGRWGILDISRSPDPYSLNEVFSPVYCVFSGLESQLTTH